MLFRSRRRGGRRRGSRICPASSGSAAATASSAPTKWRGLTSPACVLQGHRQGRLCQPGRALPPELSTSLGSGGGEHPFPGPGQEQGQAGGLGLRSWQDGRLLANLLVPWAQLLRRGVTSLGEPPAQNPAPCLSHSRALGFPMQHLLGPLASPAFTASLRHFWESCRAHSSRRPVKSEWFLALC